MPGSFPAYLELFRSGELEQRAQHALAQLADCAMCGRQCHANRLADAAPETPDPQTPGEWAGPHAAEGGGSPKSAKQQRPFCRTGRWAVVSSFFPHHGEEPCLRGWGGSGTIFFTHCNLRCIFCQNWDISWQGEGQPVQATELADMMLALQQAGCHNINFVTPSHVTPQILEALVLAAAKGLRLPLVYNTGGYDRVETLRLLDGVIDIYMPDVKFLDSKLARRWAAAPDYPEVVRAAVREMHRQVGDLQIDERGLAVRGLLVRHLVLPNNLSGTKELMEFISQETSPHTYVNIMAQYRPAYQASRYPGINRPIAREEYRA
ncbi:MAG TPA: radical SAM protein, partial [Thermoguttaceae bacterium]|nr:radical SAM protein [Thermoguttaceae bacterium]